MCLQDLGIGLNVEPVSLFEVGNGTSGVLVAANPLRVGLYLNIPPSSPVAIVASYNGSDNIVVPSGSSSEVFEFTLKTHGMIVTKEWRFVSAGGFAIQGFELITNRNIINKAYASLE